MEGNLIEEGRSSDGKDDLFGYGHKVRLYVIDQNVGECLT